ncbi:MAG TPA: NAD-dependent epimerase/dehydratase family protein [Cyclobacteriaceae bacterium]|nr:NAD-dependent epimerase/dehydratase family protein [Cyclobacteriaceae bacterium]
MQTILGANGTIGKLLARELKTYSEQIRLVSRKPQKINETDELFPADLSDPAQVDGAVKGSKVVYLLIGFEYNIRVWQKNWPTLMRAVLDACIKYNSKLVFFDNMYLYDKDAISHMTENSTINPPSKKGKVRKEISDMLFNDVKSGKVKALIARSADFYGPDNERSFLIEVVYKNLKKGKSPMWFMDMNKKHSFTFTPDAAKAIAILGNADEAYNQVWHVPTDPNTLTGKEIISLFQAEMKTDKKITVIPMWMLKIIGIFMPLMREMPEMMYQYDRGYVFDSSKFIRRFNFQPTPYSLGVKKTIENN